MESAHCGSETQDQQPEAPRPEGKQRDAPRAEYRPPDFVIDNVELSFTLGEEETLVESRLKLRRNQAAGTPKAPLRLDGEELTLVSIAICQIYVWLRYF